VHSIIVFAVYVTVPQIGVDQLEGTSQECLTNWKWTAIPNTKIHNGRANNSPSISDCKSSCITAPGCSGFDWSADSPIGQKCWLSGSWSAQWVNGTASGVTHFILSQGCEDESMTRAADHQSSRSQTGESNGLQREGWHFHSRQVSISY